MTKGNLSAAIPLALEPVAQDGRRGLEGSHRGLEVPGLFWAPFRKTRSSERHVEKDPKKSQKWRKERLRSRDTETEVGTARKK